MEFRLSVSVCRSVLVEGQLLTQLAEDSATLWDALSPLATIRRVPAMRLLRLDPSLPVAARLESGFAQLLGAKGDGAICLAIRESGSWLTSIGGHEANVSATLVRLLTPSTIYTIPHSSVIDVVSARRELVKAAARLAVHEHAFVVSRALQLASCDVRARLLFVLGELGRVLGHRCGDAVVVRLPWTQSVLADMVGTSPETLCRLLHLLERDGTVSRQNSIRKETTVPSRETRPACIVARHGREVVARVVPSLDLPCRDARSSPMAEASSDVRAPVH